MFGHEMDNLEAMDRIRVMVREIAQQLVVNLVESYVFMTFAHGIGKQILAY